MIVLFTDFGLEGPYMSDEGGTHKVAPGNDN
jgi:hypothetical protein